MTHASHIPQLRQWFDLHIAPPRAIEVDADMLPRPGEIALFTGPSGAGKSSLLAKLRNRFNANIRWIDVAAMRLPKCATIDCFNRSTAKEAFDWLSRFGLAEARTMMLRASQLSDGERFRLRLAIALYRAKRLRRPTMLYCDEFAAALDDLTAGVVCAGLRREMSRESFGFALVLVSGRDSLIEPLAPNVIVHCDFGENTIARRDSSEE